MSKAPITETEYVDKDFYINKFYSYKIKLILNYMRIHTTEPIKNALIYEQKNIEKLVKDVKVMNSNRINIIIGYYFDTFKEKSLSKVLEDIKQNNCTKNYNLDYNIRRTIEFFYEY